MPKEQGDGHEWTVSEDWEACTKLANDILVIHTTQPESTYNTLRTCFAEEKVFIEVIDSILELDHGKSLRAQKRAKHKAEGYMIEDGRLWRIGDGSERAKARLECVTKEETVRLAWEEHRNNGHFHRDNIKAKLLNKITSPNMDQSITKAILDCGKCKSFGMTHIHSLLEPITRRHPFELMAADTLSMPKGKGGFTKLGLWMDIYAQRIWVTKLKTAATGKSSRKSYGDICDLFTASETLMTDGGPEFDNVVNTKSTPLNEILGVPTTEDVETQMAYVDQQRFDGYAQTVNHTQQRKAAFDKQVLNHHPREVVFRAGDLVQVYWSDLDFTFKTERKMLPKFSAPRRVVKRNQNSYQLETLEGLPIAGKFSSRRLHPFVPRKGTELEEVQAAIEKEWRAREEIEDRVERRTESEETDEEVDQVQSTSDNEDRDSDDINQTSGARNKFES
jgi:hypothetical protein